jgi:hypothetical protein
MNTTSEEFFCSIQGSLHETNVRTIQMFTRVVLLLWTPNCLRSSNQQLQLGWWYTVLLRDHISCFLGEQKHRLKIQYMPYIFCPSVWNWEAGKCWTVGSFVEIVPTKNLGWKTSCLMSRYRTCTQRTSIFVSFFNMWSSHVHRGTVSRLLSWEYWPTVCLRALG